MILKIVKYPDPILSQVGEAITEFNADLHTLIADLFETTYANQGIGLSAHQVGIAKRVAVIDISRGESSADKLVLINPEIIFKERFMYEEEGCLSFSPDIREKIVRYAKVTVRSQNEQGEWFEMDGENLLSRAMQHEIDHLDGILFIFRMSSLKRNLNMRKIRKMQQK
jgi:peptide deformylase